MPMGLSGQSLSSTGGRNECPPFDTLCCSLVSWIWRLTFPHPLIIDCGGELWAMQSTRRRCLRAPACLAPPLSFSLSPTSLHSQGQYLSSVLTANLSHTPWLRSTFLYYGRGDILVTRNHTPAPKWTQVGLKGQQATIPHNESNAILTGLWESSQPSMKLVYTSTH